MAKGCGGFKNSETLLGIETWIDYVEINWKGGFKNSETLLGIETHWGINSGEVGFKGLRPRVHRLLF